VENRRENFSTVTESITKFTRIYLGSNPGSKLAYNVADLWIGLIYGLFNDAACSSQYMTSNYFMISE
jgi:hypothetical protein